MEKHYMEAGECSVDAGIAEHSSAVETSQPNSMQQQLAGLASAAAPAQEVTLETLPPRFAFRA